MSVDFYGHMAQQMFNSQAGYNHQLPYTGINTSYPSKFDISSEEKNAEAINNLHEKTKELLKVLTQIEYTPKLEAIAIIDKFVRAQLFDNKFETFITKE